MVAAFLRFSNHRCWACFRMIYEYTWIPQGWGQKFGEQRSDAEPEVCGETGRLQRILHFQSCNSTQSHCFDSLPILLWLPPHKREIIRSIFDTLISSWEFSLKTWGHDVFKKLYYHVLSLINVLSLAWALCEKLWEEFTMPRDAESYRMYTPDQGRKLFSPRTPRRVLSHFPFQHVEAYFLKSECIWML